MICPGFIKKYLEQTMTKFVGTTEGLIDWQPIIDSIVPMTGEMNNVTEVVDRSEATAVNDEQLLGYYREVIGRWRDAGYDLDKIKWWDYYPGIDFPIEVEQKFADLVNADPLRVFVSEVLPGQCVPYHWDVEDKEKEWLPLGDLVRFVCFMDKPKFGHVLIIEDECFYNTPQHQVYQWDNYRNYHAGTNCGTEPYYLFHFLGRPR